MVVINTIFWGTIILMLAFIGEGIGGIISAILFSIYIIIWHKKTQKKDIQYWINHSLKNKISKQAAFDYAIEYKQKGITSSPMFDNINYFIDDEYNFVLLMKAFNDWKQYNNITSEKDIDVAADKLSVCNLNAPISSKGYDKTTKKYTSRWFMKYYTYYANGNEYSRGEKRYLTNTWKIR